MKCPRCNGLMIYERDRDIMGVFDAGDLPPKN